MKSKLEQKIDKELADLGVRPYIYHIRAYGKGSQRKLLRVFNVVTIADVEWMSTTDVENDVGRLIDGLLWALAPYDTRPEIQPATWIIRALNGDGYYGVAICDRRDNFSRKRGRIIAKGRLLKHLEDK